MTDDHRTDTEGFTWKRIGYKSAVLLFYAGLFVIFSTASVASTQNMWHGFTEGDMTAVSKYSDRTVVYENDPSGFTLSMMVNAGYMLFVSGIHLLLMLALSMLVANKFEQAMWKYIGLAATFSLLCYVSWVLHAQFGAVIKM